MMKEVLLTSLCRPKQWKTISTSELKESGYPVFGANGIIGYYSEYTHEEPTLLITCRGATCGKINISLPKSYVNGNAMALDNLSKDVDITYLKYYLEQRGLDDVISGSAQPQITGQNLKKLQIPLPPLPQQKKIAAILDAADAYRQKTKALIAKYDELTQSLFLDMFGDPVMNEKGWEVKKIIEIVNPKRPITYGILMPKENIKPLGKPYIKVVDVKDGLILKDQVCHTSEEIESKYVRSRLQENDIIISIRGHVGRICIVPKDFQGANITQDTARLDLKNALSPEFAESCFNSAEFQRYINRYVKGAGVKGINLGDLKNLTVPVPTRKFQDQFSNQAKNIKTQKAQAKASLDKAEELFNSLLQRAFKGELT